MILYGPPGTGKTSIANAIIGELNKNYRFLNAVINKKEDFDIVIEEAKMAGEMILVIDEIHRMNKDKQDLLLPYLKSGLIVIIGLTTANPYHAINAAIRSRCQIFEVKPLSENDIFKGLKKACEFLPDITISDETVSVITTLSGGDLFPVEVTYYKGQGNLILTGNDGLELKESALVALDYVRANASKFGIKIADLLENDIHINLPHYEITKDGPSIGVALVTGIISAFKKKIIPNDISMTGEISLLGEVLPIGNILSKIEIAHYNNLKTIFIPKDNSIDLTKASKDLLNGIEIIKVEDYSEIYERIFL